MRENEQLSAKKLYVQERLKGAARTLHRLPEKDMLRYPNMWCHMPIRPSERGEPKLRLHPSSKDIAQMEEVLFVWFGWLTGDERKLVWQRPEHVRWKLICIQFGMGRTKAWEMYRCALGKIAALI